MIEWLSGLSRGSKWAVAFVAFVVFSGTVAAIADGGGAPLPSDSAEVPVQVADTPEPDPEPEPEVEKRTETTVEGLPYTSSTVDDALLEQGVTQVRTVGAEGQLTRTFEVTYVDGVERSRVEVDAIVTTPAVNEVIVRGTKAPPPPPPAPAAPAANCPNGTYTNSAGATVCRPHQSDSAPPGATAQCRNGSYSFSQSRQGTCSGNGGVARWL